MKRFERGVRIRGYLKDGSVPGERLPSDVGVQRGSMVDLTDFATGERILRCLKATITLDHEGVTKVVLEFADGTTEEAFAFVG